MEICENVEQMLADRPKNNNINMDAPDLTDKPEWSVNVRLKKQAVGGDRFGE
jgi:hypothetical protein